MQALEVIFNMALRKIKGVEEKKKAKTKRKAVVNSMGAIVLEESIFMSKFRYKTVVLLCAAGVGRRDVTVRLIANHPQKYGSPTVHTTRAAKPYEIENSRYTFVSRQQMMTDIMNNKFLENGLFQGDLYGVKLDSIRTIIGDGKIAILEIRPENLRHVRNPEFAPFVVFIDPPLLYNAIDFDGTITRINNESEQIKRDYGHLINTVIVMNDMSETIVTLAVVIEDAINSPQWISSSWVNRRGCH